MTDWDSANQQARDDLLEEFARTGFDVRSTQRVEGEIDVDGRPVPVDITIPDGFPYAAPKVRPIDGSGGLSWHADLDGHLCLWADEESGDLPWRDVAAIIDRVRVWFRNDAAGWPDDAPDLDLERYWPRTLGLVIVPDLDALVGRTTRLERAGNNVWRVKPGPPPRQSRQRCAIVVDVGELDRPLRTFDDILQRSGEVAPRLESGVTRGHVQVVIVRYWRRGLPATLALLVTSRQPVTLEASSAAAADDATLHLRAGHDREILAKLRVAVIGVGAVGSEVAALLARAGIGGLTLVDFDLIRPGNCVRHLAGPDAIGQPKVLAVTRVLELAKLMAADHIAARQELLSTPSAAAEILTEHDLVVDATANGVATRLLLDAGQHFARPVVSICLTHDGRVARIDRAPLEPGEAYAEAPDEPSDTVRLREGGCGDPVSAAPMWAVAVAAARGTAVVVDQLTGRRQYSPSVVDVLVARHPPYDRVGTVT